MAITRCRPGIEAEIEAEIEWRTRLIIASLDPAGLEAVADRLTAICNALPETVPVDHQITRRLTAIAAQMTTPKP